jgi:hypothetical protein
MREAYKLNPPPVYDEHYAATQQDWGEDGCPNESGNMSYLKTLEDSFAMTSAHECPPESRLAYLSENIFDFTTYDGAMSDLFGRKAVEVCAAITNGTTFDYIADQDNHRWFLLMVNMPFFAGRLDWGTSIRGAWWSAYPDKHFEFQSCGLWDGGEQQTGDLLFTEEEWKEFMRAVIEFAAPEMAPVAPQPES